LEIQQAARRIGNGRRAKTWIGPAQMSQRPVYSYNNTPPLINNGNLNNSPIMDNRHRKEGKKKRFDVTKCHYCNKLRDIASECRILAFEKRNRRSEENRVITTNNTDPRFRGRNETPPSNKYNDGRRPHPPINTDQNNQNYGPEKIKRNLNM
jgi:hypothetical protein